MAETVLVCVTGQRSSEQLIHRGAELAQAQAGELLVLSVSGSGLNTLTDPTVVQALDGLYRLSSQVGAEMTMLQSSDPHKAICDFVKERQVTRIVLGQPRTGGSGFITGLMRALPRVAFTLEETL